jgi:hypothetical protein
LLFADLDPQIERALSKMCKMFSFSSGEVLEQWDISGGHLQATKDALEKNRSFLGRPGEELW